jgi:hypothetical protein
MAGDLRAACLIFGLIFFAIFGAANMTRSGSAFATGANTWNGYGWPSQWLFLHFYETRWLVKDHWENTSRFACVEIFSWGQCLVSILSCGAIASGFVLIPLTGARLLRLRYKTLS